MITYEKLWKRMKELGISQYRLHMEGISNSTLTRLRRNESVNMETIDKLCSILQCDVGDIMEFIPNPESENLEETKDGDKKPSV